jgi:hypothetical protein
MRLMASVPLNSSPSGTPYVAEHPDRVAQRLIRLANMVGRGNVMGGTDCGFAQGAFVKRAHEEIQWAKLASLAEGPDRLGGAMGVPRLASKDRPQA